MANYNRVMLMGNMTRDVDLRYTPSNTAVASFTIAVNRRYTTSEGERREEVTFVDCEAWGKTGETIKNYLGKGRPIFVEGRLKLDTWQDQQGEKKSKMKVVVEAFQFVDNRPAESRGQPAAQGAAQTTSAPLDESDIPF